MEFNNGLIVQFAYKQDYTSAGSTAQGTIILPISYTQRFNCVITPSRNDNNFSHSNIYGFATYCGNLAQFTYRGVAVNNAQFITGFDWITIGY